MPVPNAIGRINRAGLNRVTTPLARRLPGFGVVIHRGRRSGRTYRTPVNVFPREGGYVVALTYGRSTDWLRNVLAQGGCELETRGHVVRLIDPRVFHDETRRRVNPLVRPILRLIRVEDFVALVVDSRRRHPSGGNDQTKHGR